MRKIFGSVVLCLLFSQSVSANSRSFLTNGFESAVYGDITVDQGQVNKDKMSALRIKAGLQLLRFGPVGLGLAYQKVGFYTATKNWGRDSGSQTFDHWGPAVELHFFPSSLVSLSISGATQKGAVVRVEKQPSAYGYSCGSGCTIANEKSAVKVMEYSGQLGLRVAPQILLTIGGGVRNWKGATSYESSNSAADGSLYTDYPAGAWEKSSSFVMFGLRGTTL